MRLQASALALTAVVQALIVQSSSSAGNLFSEQGEAVILAVGYWDRGRQWGREEST
jgi:hypothetical protein